MPTGPRVAKCGPEGAVGVIEHSSPVADLLSTATSRRRARFSITRSARQRLLPPMARATMETRKTTKGISTRVAQLLCDLGCGEVLGGVKTPCSSSFRVRTVFRGELPSPIPERPEKRRSRMNHPLRSLNVSNKLAVLARRPLRHVA